MPELVTYSPYIYAIADWLMQHDVWVVLYDELPEWVAGRYTHDARHIGLKGGYPAKETVMTLAHEAGHWLGYLIDEKAESYQRERQAFAYGWHVLKWFEVPITRKEWIDDELERRHWVSLKNV